MRLKLFWVAVCMVGVALPAGDPAGFKMWKSDELKMQTKMMRPQMNDQKLATQQLGGTGNYSFMLAHREASGEAEQHDTQADVFVVETGEATLVVGGKIESPRTSAPNEIRGPSITGGVEKPLMAGDVVTIPIKTPHQLKLGAGKQITYFVVKVTQ